MTSCPVRSPGKTSRVSTPRLRRPASTRLAPVQEVGGGGALVERGAVRRGAVSQGKEVVVAKEDSQGQVPARKVFQVFAENLAAHLVEEVCQHDHQRPLPAPLLQFHERTIIAWFDRFGKDVVNRMHQPANQACATTGGNERPGAVGECQQPHLVVPREGHVGQQEHGVERMVQGREAPAGVAGHHPPAIDQEKDALALVVLEGANGQLSPPGRGPPVQVPRVVSLNVVAQPLELVVGTQPS